jgi:hypothetical protein
MTGQHMECNTLTDDATSSRSLGSQTQADQPPPPVTRLRHRDTPPSGMASIGELRSKCARKQVEIEDMVDSIAYFQAQVAHDRIVFRHLVPLCGKWHEVPVPEVMKLIVSFLKPNIRPLVWYDYPPMEGTDNDPVLPYHAGHYLRGGMTEANGGEEFHAGLMEETRRLEVKSFYLTRQMQHMYKDHNQWFIRHLRWVRIRHRVEASIQIKPDDVLTGRFWHGR